MIDPRDYPEWLADDLAALSTLVRAYAFMGADSALDRLHASLPDEVAVDIEYDQLESIAADVANEMVDHFARELKDYERDGTWDMERMVLERMRGNPAARPATPAAN